MENLQAIINILNYGVENNGWEAKTIFELEDILLAKIISEDIQENERKFLKNVMKIVSSITYDLISKKQI